MKRSNLSLPRLSNLLPQGTETGQSLQWNDEYKKWTVSLTPMADWLILKPSTKPDTGFAPADYAFLYKSGQNLAFTVNGTEYIINTGGTYDELVEEVEELELRAGVFDETLYDPTTGLVVRTETLEDETKELKIEVDDSKLLIDNLDNQINNPTTGIEKRLTDAEEELKEIDSTLTIEEEKLDELDTEINAPTVGLKDRIEQTETDYTILDSDYTNLYNSYSSLNTEVNEPETGINARLTTLEENFNASEILLNNLNDQVQNMQNSYDESKNVLDSNVIILGNTVNTLSSAEDDLKNATDQLLEAEEDLESYEEKLDIANSNLLQADEDFKEANTTTLNTAIYDLNELKESVDEYELKVTELEENLESIDGEFKLAEDEFKLAEDEFKLAEDEFKLAEENLNIADDELKLAEENLSTAGDNLELAETELKNAGDELKLAGDNLELAETELKNAGDELKLSEDDLKEANDEFKLAEDDFKEANDEFKLAEENLETAEENLNLAENNLISAEDDLKEANDDFKEANDDFKIAEDDFKEANDEFKIAEDDIKLAEDDIKLAEDDIDDLSNINTTNTNTLNSIVNVYKYNTTPQYINFSNTNSNYSLFIGSTTTGAAPILTSIDRYKILIGNNFNPDPLNGVSTSNICILTDNKGYDREFPWASVFIGSNFGKMYVNPGGQIDGNSAAFAIQIGTNHFPNANEQKNFLHNAILIGSNIFPDQGPGNTRIINAPNILIGSDIGTNIESLLPGAAPQSAGAMTNVIGFGTNILGGKSGTITDGTVLRVICLGNDINFDGTTMNLENCICIDPDGTLEDYHLENNTISIGNSNMTECYIFGITGRIALLGTAVYISPTTHRLGTVSSSIKYKKDIISIDDEVLDKIELIEGKSFTYKNDPNNIKQYGFIAEDFHNLGLTDFVIYKNDSPDSVKYHFMYSVLLELIKRRSNKINNLKSRIEILENIMLNNI